MSEPEQQAPAMAWRVHHKVYLTPAPTEKLVDDLVHALEGYSAEIVRQADATLTVRMTVTGHAINRGAIEEARSEIRALLVAAGWRTISFGFGSAATALNEDGEPMDRFGQALVESRSEHRELPPEIDHNAKARWSFSQRPDPKQVQAAVTETIERAIGVETARVDEQISLWVSGTTLVGMSGLAVAHLVNDVRAVLTHPSRAGRALAAVHLATLPVSYVVARRRSRDKTREPFSGPLAERVGWPLFSGTVWAVGRAPRVGTVRAVVEGAMSAGATMGARLVLKRFTPSVAQRIERDQQRRARMKDVHTRLVEKREQEAKA